MQTKNEIVELHNSVYPIKKPIKDIKLFNYGLAILKSYLAFLVVISHQFSRKTTKNKIILKLTSGINYHVPCFFIMSFYFMCNNLLSLNLKKIVNRFIRLFTPYIGWPFIILVINKIYNKMLKKSLPDSFEILKLQLMWGAPLVPQFWFQWDLIVTTLIFVIIIFAFRKHYLFILQLILIFSYHCQYTRNYFKKYLHLNQHNIYTIGRMFEMFPLGITGFILGSYDIIKIIHPIKFQAFALSFLIKKFIEDCKVFSGLGGFLYQGIKLNIRSMCIIFIFSLFPNETMTNKYLNKLIFLITKYSAGIFYLHLSIKKYLKDYNTNVKNGTFLGTIFNYIICYSISSLGDIIFGKTHLKYLFC